MDGGYHAKCEANNQHSSTEQPDENKCRKRHERILAAMVLWSPSSCSKTGHAETIGRSAKIRQRSRCPTTRRCPGFLLARWPGYNGGMDENPYKSPESPDTSRPLDPTKRSSVAAAIIALGIVMAMAGAGTALVSFTDPPADLAMQELFRSLRWFLVAISVAGWMIGSTSLAWLLRGCPYIWQAENSTSREDVASNSR